MMTAQQYFIEDSTLGTLQQESDKYSGNVVNSAQAFHFCQAQRIIYCQGVVGVGQVLQGLADKQQQLWLSVSSSLIWQQSRTVPTRCYFCFYGNYLLKMRILGEGYKQRSRLESILGFMLWLTLTMWSSLQRFGSNFGVLSLSKTSISSQPGHMDKQTPKKPRVP